MIIGQAEVVAIARTTSGEPPQELDHIYRFAAKLVRTMRPEGDSAPAWPQPLVVWGAGPRGPAGTMKSRALRPFRLPRRRSTR